VSNARELLPETVKTGDDDELVEGQIEVEILRIIVPDAPETDGGRR